MSIEKAFLGNLMNIKETVIVSPVFYPSKFGLKGVKTAVGNIVVNGSFTFIKTYPGLPWTSDTILSLKKSKAKKVVFIGTAGSLNSIYKIGDVAVVKTATKCISSFHDKPRGELIDLEVESFFAACRKIKIKGIAVLVIQDLPRTKPFYKPLSRKDSANLDAGITKAIELCKKLAKSK